MQIQMALQQIMFETKGKLQMMAALQAKLEALQGAQASMATDGYC